MRVNVGGYELEVATVATANPKGPAVVYLHGFAGVGHDWASMAGHLSNTCGAVLPDLVGHGASDAPEDPKVYTFDGQTKALARLADALGLEAPIWVGYSYGGRILLHFALANPKRVSALVLESVHPGLVDPQARARRAEQDQQDARALEDDGLEAFLARWYRRPAFDTRRRHSRAWKEERARRLATNRPLPLARCLRGAGLGVQEPLLEPLAGIRAPTLLVSGSLDPVYCELARSMAQRLPSSKMELVTLAGHGVHLENAATFRHLLRTFIEDKTLVPPARPGA